ncbi:probable 6-phosphogluconolactonase 2 isoform X2 [Andrographis paniculata]|uniref:probable 6-phosphogluconolactonase 2 isoform X2 n=1 Tax=Andrographis paniculata TaxID=175694 RepID=UPI0021E8C1AC|nr:probable 6-phosphogluconolactonase 2 isoform X2 [Andrographis paniculata]
MSLSYNNKQGREVRIHESLDELSSGLAEYMAELSEASIKERGAFTVALPCGSLVPFLRKLCDSPYNKTVDWNKWHVFWTDERVVAKNHSDSNYKVAKDGLLSKVPIARGHVHSINDAVAADRAAEEYEFVIRQLVKKRVVSASETNDCPRFDLIILGLGPDGHVASLFPNHSVLDEEEHWVTFITDSPKPPPERITFTLPVINSAANVAVIISGSSRAEAARLVIDETAPDCPELPARMVQPINGELVWFVDTAAASELEFAKFHI